LFLGKHLPNSGENMNSKSFKLLSIAILTSAGILTSFAQPSHAFPWSKKTQTIELGQTSTGDVTSYCRQTRKCSSLTSAVQRVNPNTLCKWKHGNDYNQNDIYGKWAKGSNIFGVIPQGNAVDCFAKNQPIEE
jgi:hypothetical protein